jgi:hypothetical protein
MAKNSNHFRNFAQRVSAFCISSNFQQFPHLETVKLVSMRRRDADPSGR